MQVTGPFDIADGGNYKEYQPSPLQVAIIVANNSPYQLTVSLSSKTYTLAPYMQDLILKAPNVNLVELTATALSGTVPSGANSSCTITWLNVNDPIDKIAIGHPIALTPNAQASGSVVSGNVDITGPLQGTAVEVDTKVSATATISTVASSAAAQVLASANASRRGLVIANNSTETCLVAFGSTATATNFSVVLAAGATYSPPAPCYTGELSVIWPTAGTGNCTATQLT